jgi:hypothetical protein
LVLASLVWALAASGGQADANDALLQQAHAWGRCAKGAWRKVRIVTENFDERGKLASSSITENKTTVDEITADRVTLKVEATVEVAGQKFPSQPQIIKLGYAGEQTGQSVSIKPLADATLSIAGRRIECRTEQIEILGGAAKEVTLISYAPQLTPTILKRQSTISDAASGKTTQESVSEVSVFEKRVRVLGEERTAFSVRQILRTDRGNTTTESDHVRDIPGEVVAQSSKKSDNEGRMVRRSTLELIGYGLDDQDSYYDLGRGRRRHKRAR